jgi:hypothetical protein
VATSWPTVDDVKAYLRLGDGATPDDGLVADQLAAAIGWVSSRVDQLYVPGSATYGGTLPDPLYTVAVMEAGRLYRRRDSVDGTVGWGDMGVVRVGPKDPDIETMIAAYLVVVVG